MWSKICYNSKCERESNSLEVKNLNRQVPLGKEEEEIKKQSGVKKVKGVEVLGFPFNIGVRNPPITQPLVKAKPAVGIAQKPFNLQSIYYHRRDGPRGHSLERRARFPRKTGRNRTDVQGWRSSLFRMMDQAAASELIRNTFVWWHAS
ncbi:hypothetical protein CDAR_385611 [Caerostris darwini]|uniref:Uncharacterized protein n=1 Tax=Caerostris darwini TaxID=1538125 RepID=A0AAV4M510_9ARAC|nr:hypothetical protein CDAR_385611 [Caerostris darwini]